MKAIVCESFGPPDALVLRDLPDPTPGEGEVVVDVHAAGVNYPDALMVQGRYQVRPPTPFTPGAEAAGVVSAVGADVRHVMLM
ncbi:alcohol dehydrogenase catalytic domain-containing protein [Deinococcus pimensis]|uniref:alcohol dehydrogenase catalytic domain-containing protein n=1 Tax=Deinococcus pimensis TaxID=309888 RepID=UPI0004AE08C1|nr:alcohol dehydrogenase catalytic domain-containing protein [Deinococcus pimensis]